MNVLLVDDQRAVVDSLKQNIHWDSIPVEKVYTACSAKEAKMVLRNFKIDVLITDIEMPEEDGLSLYKWVKDNTPGVEGVFLTSHADFEYVREAIHMGGFDYILQPVRYEDVEETLKKLLIRLKKQKRINHLENTRELIYEQRNTVLDGLLLKATLGKKDEVNQLYESFPDIVSKKSQDVLAFPVLVQVVRWQGISEIWNEKLLRFMLCNVMDELFEIANPFIAVSSLDRDTYWILLILDKKKVDFSFYKHRIEDFYSFIESNMEFTAAIYPASGGKVNFWDIYEQLNKIMSENKARKSGVFWTKEKGTQAASADEIYNAKKYIAENISRKISRSEVAAHVHLNESYFSRLFHQQTGLTFKEYILFEKMELAKELLRNSKLSVSIVASKVGSDNFSHFCKMFKKITNQTPQEYRKIQGKKNS